MALDQTLDTPINDKRIINGWAFFDWANSAFALVITAAIFPAYFIGVTTDQIHFLGRTFNNDALYSYSISAAYIIIAILAPILSGIADYGGRKMYFMRMFTTLGASACIALFWFEGDAQVAIGTFGFILGMVGFAGGQVFYNSYLPQIVSEDKYDSVSAKGFTYGYIGSVILLVINLITIQKPELFGLKDGVIASRWSFIAVGLWWIGFSMIPFRRLPKDVPKKGHDKQLVRKGFQELFKVWHYIKDQKNIKGFLLSFFFYSAGVQTVLYLAGAFAEKELNFETSELIILILILQIVAIGGAWIFSKISDFKGNKIALISMLIIWTLICVIAYTVQEKIHFYLLGIAVGMVMGGIQSLSRSTYSKLLPDKTEDTASFFSFYEAMEKIAIIVGTLSFGLISEITGSMKMSILTLGAFFLLGLIALLPVKIKTSQKVA